MEWKSGPNFAETSLRERIRPNSRMHRIIRAQLYVNEIMLFKLRHEKFSYDCIIENILSIIKFKRDLRTERKMYDVWNYNK